MCIRDSLWYDVGEVISLYIRLRDFFYTYAVDSSIQPGMLRAPPKCSSAAAAPANRCGQCSLYVS